MPHPSPYTIDSIGKLIDDNYQIALYCENQREHGLTCGFVKWIDLEKLAEKLGRDHGIMYDDLAPHLFCTKCGGKEIAVRLHPDTRPER